MIKTYEKIATVFKLEERAVIDNLDAENTRILLKSIMWVGIPLKNSFQVIRNLVKITGVRDSENLVNFINEKCGTSCDARENLTSNVSCSYVFTDWLLFYCRLVLWHLWTALLRSFQVLATREEFSTSPWWRKKLGCLSGPLQDLLENW